MTCEPGSNSYLLSLKGINICDNELKKLLSINMQPLSIKYTDIVKKY